MVLYNECQTKGVFYVVLYGNGDMCEFITSRRVDVAVEFNMSIAIICEVCNHWKIVQEVRREVPSFNRYYIFEDFMECEKKFIKVVDRNCPGFSQKDGEK